MRITFTAHQVGFHEDDELIVCGVTDDHHYLTFQRDGEAADDDWGVHLEYLDQSNGSYDAISVCRLTRERLRVDLSRQLGQLVDVTGFDVELRIDEGAYGALRHGLTHVFRDRPGVLIVE
jgi:hypothetical protein